MLYQPRLEKENCGFGLIAHIDGIASHKLVRTAISALDRMTHRGGIAADGKTGDGCGLLLQKPDQFFQHIATENSWKLNRLYGVGMFFLSQDPIKAQHAIDLIEQELHRETLTIVGWRDVPIAPTTLGEIAQNSLPKIKQIFINAPTGWQKKDVDRRLYMARRRVEQKITEAVDADFYVCSLSTQIVIYKGLFMPADLPRFYTDLADLRMESAICLFHQRFSTNTMPRWPLAQPFRYLAHNGEINTIQGNRQWARARAYKFASPLLPDLQDAAPFVNETGSDSSSLDNMLELFLAGGMDLFRAMRMLVPPAWQHNKNMDPDLRAFYDFNIKHMEPWDGPAGIVMSDGRYAACNLDRNGLRPARYVITKDRLITLASEIGIWDYAPDEVLEKGRVGPGELLVIDTREGRIWHSDEIDHDLMHRHPYQQWLEQHVHNLVPFETLVSTTSNSNLPVDLNKHFERQFDDKTLRIYHKQFVLTNEETEQIINVMANNGMEATMSMGDDTPIAVLSTHLRPITDYFRQMFAQVTNPPIDPLREKHVMSLGTSVGKEMNVFTETDGQAQRVSFASPVLMPTDFEQLKNLDPAYYRHQMIDLNYDPKEKSLKQAIEDIGQQAEEYARDGAVLLILTDRTLFQNKQPIPAAMVVGSIQNHLVNNKLRCDTNIIVETGSVRDPHQFAVLLGFGTTAIYPYLAFETIKHQIEIGAIKKTGSQTESITQAFINYQQGVNKGLLKIMSKMGISTISSYRCSQLFEVIGLNKEVTDLCFNGVSSRINGATFDELELELTKQSKAAWRHHQPMPHIGLLKYSHNGEYHCYNPDVVQMLQKAMKSGLYSDYKLYADIVNKRPVATLRDLFVVKKGKSIPLDHVEQAESLYSRFDTAAMSVGSLSPEAHEALAIAMNRLGGRSNSGEGGEDPNRFNSERNSKIKQIASGRFGVTPHYLVNAEVIQIKVAQGAKPGEGGQLPGHKVTTQIAKLRHSVPGVTLISPPPHHDIYSIEDLAQLIFDIKQINPQVLVSVKLVSEPGVGTIAVGVAKAYADLITISGYDGGTGASPLTSVKHAGSPWELGLAETHQALVANGLRHKIRLQVDGGLKTGLDIIKAAILGAESFGFGTGPMVALGCKYLRICHLNNCATGIATQDPILREKYYNGLPELVINYFKGVTQEVREWLAYIGVHSFTDIIGQTQYLSITQGDTVKHSQLYLNDILAKAPILRDIGSDIISEPLPMYCTQTNNGSDSGSMNNKLIELAKNAIKQEKTVDLFQEVINTDRSIGARLSGYICQRHGRVGLADSRVNLYLTGTAGQSLGVWNAKGLYIHLVGDANDYVGKGMNGGLICIYPPAGSAFLTQSSTIIGNTCLYGATGGKLFAAGQAGERFAVRNSGATAVVEGCGENGCEYMTGGVVAILGKIGINFGAGMTGGFAYILDNGNLDSYINLELVEYLPLATLKVHQEHLRSLINRHVQLTDSAYGHEILSHFELWIERFCLIKPKSANIDSLLGHKSLSTQELIVQAQ